MPSVAHFASKVMGGSTNNKKDTAGRRLGLKKWGKYTQVHANEIIIR
eukprot:CAMPEP_0116883666 /NCGR_PEP_ID=MMETSP0463-20121206/16251_1 /TAXON_ID=181622 /ORGANISM="Strombidinopsis sp, Strain SopsisLIS2011" /LENGTH=46 /DNA_ID= /DNA_START= /DNA_END= /DNA_ORIENTATION=